MMAKSWKGNNRSSMYNQQDLSLDTWLIRGTKNRNGEIKMTFTALLMSRTHREPVNVVMTAGNKADGILVGTEGKYSSMAANFR